MCLRFQDSRSQQLFRLKPTCSGTSATLTTWTCIHFQCPKAQGPESYRQIYSETPVHLTGCAFVLSAQHSNCSHSSSGDTSQPYWTYLHFHCPKVEKVTNLVIQEHQSASLDVPSYQVVLTIIATEILESTNSGDTSHPLEVRRTFCFSTPWSQQ